MFVLVGSGSNSDLYQSQVLMLVEQNACIIWGFSVLYGNYKVSTLFKFT